MYSKVYRQLLNNAATVYIANNICCSSETILVFTVNMDVFLESLSCGCCVDIQNYEVYNILSNAARLYKLILHCCCDVIMLFIMQVTTVVSLNVSTVNCNSLYGKCHYVWNDNINLELQELECEGLNWVEMAVDRDSWRALGTAVLNLWVS